MFFSSKIITPVVLAFILPGASMVNGLLFSRQATTCNGHAELCDRSFGNVTFVGAHDSYAIGNPRNNLAVNQDQNVTQQLNDGIRMLQMQAHNLSGTIQLCHTSCDLFNGGSLSDYLGTVKTWMDGNPNDVLSLLIVNSDPFSAAQYDAVFQSVGLSAMAYAPPTASVSVSEWPTLGTMISSGKRLVVFLTAHAEFTSVPYIIDEFSNIWETPFDVTGSFDCSVNRTNGTPSDQMFLINHFLDKVLLGFDTPDSEDANVTNSASGPSSLGAQVDTCVAATSKNPNFMLVDFYEFGGGSVFEVAAAANGVPYNPTTPIATPSASSGGGKSGAVALHLSRNYVYTSLAAVSGIFVVAFSIL